MASINVVSCQLCRFIQILSCYERTLRNCPRCGALLCADAALSRANVGS